MITIDNIDIRRVLRIQAASGCPALTGERPRGSITENTFRCEGNGEKACDKCPIRNRLVSTKSQ